MQGAQVDMLRFMQDNEPVVVSGGRPSAHAAGQCHQGRAVDESFNSAACLAEDRIPHRGRDLLED